MLPGMVLLLYILYVLINTIFFHTACGGTFSGLALINCKSVHSNGKYLPRQIGIVGRIHRGAKAMTVLKKKDRVRCVICDIPGWEDAQFSSLVREWAIGTGLAEHWDVKL